MVKYTTTMVTFEEIPDKVTLSVAISNCKGSCPGCHSPELRQNIGIELTTNEIDRLIKKNEGINCFLFLGEGNNTDEILKLSRYIKDNYSEINTAIYIGREFVDNDEEIKFGLCFNYVKTGGYNAALGPLNSSTTNQRLYEIYIQTLPVYRDITHRFWRNNCK